MATHSRGYKVLIHILLTDAEWGSLDEIGADKMLTVQKAALLLIQEGIAKYAEEGICMALEPTVRKNAPGGGRKPNTKLNDHILYRLINQSGRSQKSIATELGVSQSHVAKLWAKYKTSQTLAQVEAKPNGSLDS